MFLAELPLEAAVLDVLSERPWRGTPFLWPQALKLDGRAWQKGNASMELRESRNMEPIGKLKLLYA